MSRRFSQTWLAYQASSSCVFSNAIFFVFYHDQVGLSSEIIFVLQAYNIALRAVLDLPLGAFADRRSRRLCLMFGAVGVLLASLLLVVSPTLVAACVAETLFAVATALRSGADSALLYDALREADQLEDYPRNEGRGHAFAAFGAGAAAVVGGLLAAIDLRLPYAATVLAAAVSILLASRLPEAQRAAATTGRAFDLGSLRLAVRRAATTPGVGWAVGLATFTVVASHVYFYLQQPYLRSIEVPLALFGLVFAATKIVTAMVASVAHRVDAGRGERGTAALMGAVPALGLGMMALVSGPLGVLAILSRGLLDGLWMPLVNIYVNRRADSDVRATTLSLMNVVSRLALAAALACLGWTLARYGLAATLLGCALASGAAGALLVWLAPPAPTPALAS